MMSAQEKSKKGPKKSDLAFAIYQRHLHLKDTMKHRAFRTIVVDAMKEELGVTNKGTLGMYFAWSEQVITGRAAKVYSRGDGARARKGSVVDEQTNIELARLAAGSKVKVAKADDGDEEAAPLAPSFGGGFGRAAF